MVACYLRVSTQRQKNDSQRAEIARWLEASGISLGDVQWFEDKETGKTIQRKALDQLQRAIFDGKIKTVVCWKLDRLSRRLTDGINLLGDWCERGVRIVSVTQQIDLSGLADHHNFPERSCVGFYLPKDGRPKSATTATDLVFDLPSPRPLDQPA